ncbi:probable disease resistance protein At1g63360 [Eucalyptus grandis]|uniref:probable disease resistance protein At1g63360 n=1 Tax=Eucalyptus grandis TaxID=71139 RepID=UPI00192ED497|nr:probable disease resistance protein At1g63360 [Eucalyptus grandis]
MSRGFFESMMACLKVLDLSGNRNIELFPEEICDLINLRYLNISNTCISELPKEIKNLTRLQWLLLNGISNNVLIPTGVIASLPLNVFSTWESGLEKEEEVVEELGGMQELIDLSIVVHKSSSALKIFQSLQRCIRRVKIMDCKNLTCIPISHSLKGRVNFLHLEVLHLQGCRMLVKMEITQGTGQVPNYSCFPSLVEVLVEGCGFSDLSWLVHAPKLQILMVWRCYSIKKIIGDEIAGEELAASGLFSHLEFLNIGFLPKLRSICDHTLFFAQGLNIKIYDCPSLKKLPWDSSNARGSFSIYGDIQWWAEFEWDPTARVTFQWRDEGSVEEEMTFGEAVRKMNDRPNWYSTIGFRPSGPSE